jgi:hypothetical protein
VVGTDDGTFVKTTITADGDEAIVITSVDGNDETNEAGTTTIDDDGHELG